MPPDSPDDPAEMVYIKHPNVKALGGPVRRDALDSLWSRKGWILASKQDVAKADEAADAALGETTAPAEKAKA